MECILEQVNVAKANAQLSALLERVAHGEEIVIARRGKPIARLVPEPRHRLSAAEALRAAWTLGGLDIDTVSDLPSDPTAIALD